VAAAVRLSRGSERAGRQFSPLVPSKFGKSKAAIITSGAKIASANEM
jgi:hypothetical protein